MGPHGQVVPVRGRRRALGAYCRVPSHKHLGVILDNHLNFHEHLLETRTKVDKMLNPLLNLKSKVCSKHLEKMYNSFILPKIEYGSLLYGATTDDKYLDMLDKLHNRAAIIVSGVIQGTNIAKLLKSLNWKTLHERRTEKRLVLMYKHNKKLTPCYLAEIYDDLKTPCQRLDLRPVRELRLPARARPKHRCVGQPLAS